MQHVMFQLTERQQQILLQIARESVRSYLAAELRPCPEFSSGVLNEPHGIFVSIHKGRNLRGCIGNVHPAAPLYRSAAECAIAAAVGDPRFMPLTLAELPLVDFEISILSAVERIENIGEIEIGIHGLLISKKGARGLLLPQVAPAYGWDREKLLQETCRKAGLKSDDWKEGAAIYRFCALVFGETQFHLTTNS